MRRLLVLTALLAAALAPAARAQDGSPNVEQVASIPALKTAIAINFIGDTMFVSTVTGLFSYDVSDPAHPRLLGSLPMYIWENEDMDVDPVRKRVFISRDPRGFTSPAIPGSTFPFGAVHVIDVSEPSMMRQAGFFTLPAGHTSTCVNDCDFLWTGGPVNSADQPAEWQGRPIFATDVRDPANPVPCPEPIDTARNDGVTDYAHDVQVDSAGVAWVSGAGGVRGYWTSGRHLNPVSGQVEEATPCKPVPYAGSGTPAEATPSRFMHNAFRDPAGRGVPAPAATTAPSATAAPRAKKKRAAKRKRRPCARFKQRKRRRACLRERRKRAKRIRARKASVESVPAERILYGTEENIVDDCETSGRFTTYDLAGTFAGEGFRDTVRTKHRMQVLDTWTPERQEGSTGCASAHYFSSRGDGVFANAFYEQGVRFLDVSDPRDIRQIGWWRPSDANAWAPYWHKGFVFVADFGRGVDVLRFKGAAGRARAVPAPVLASAGRQPLRFDPALGSLCPLRPARS
jgi:hypothetical protein